MGYKKIGNAITVKHQDWARLEQACWEKFDTLKRNGLPANGFFIESITLLKNGGGTAEFQPIKI